MFLLDNHAVREDWNQAKAAVTDTLAKHGAEVVSARRWDERKLAYPIKRRKRATYMLTYYRAPETAGPEIRREFDLDERVLRYLLLSVKAVPAGEAELAALEDSADFVAPLPPGDDEPTAREEATEATEATDETGASETEGAQAGTEAKQEKESETTPEAKASEPAPEAEASTPKEDQ
jgi:small subunit ribosomal protein S6